VCYFSFSLSLSLSLSLSPFCVSYNRNWTRNQYLCSRRYTFDRSLPMISLDCAPSFFLRRIIDARSIILASHSLNRWLSGRTTRTMVSSVRSSICLDYSWGTILLFCRGRMLRRWGCQWGMLGTLLLRPPAGRADPHGLQERGHGGEHIFL